LPQTLLTTLIHRLVGEDWGVVAFDLNAIPKDPVPGFSDGIVMPLMKRRRMTNA
jgi:hypothetical protein